MSLFSLLVDHVPCNFISVGSPPIDPIPRQPEIHLFRSGHLYSSVCVHFDLLGDCSAGRPGKASLVS